MHFCLSLLAVIVFGIPQGATVSGKILDHQGKPFAGAQITYTSVGQWSRTATSSAGQHTGLSDAGTGKTYKAKTDKKGEFTILGVALGVYEIQVLDSAGAMVYSTKKLVGDNTDRDVSNVLNVDLSSESSPEAVGSGPKIKIAPGKAGQEQLARIRQQNTTAAAVNLLIPQLHVALGAQDWPTATDLLHQLLALDPNRWQFYQNLGTIQNSTGKHQEAAQTFAKGVELAQKGLDSAPDSVQLKADMSAMMVSEAEALNRMDKLDEAMALYNQAAALAPQPAMAYFQACNAQSNHGTPALAIELCGKAIAADSSRPEFYQVLAGAQSAAGKTQEAIATYEKGTQVAREQLAATPDSTHARNSLGQMLNAEGNLYAQQSRYDQAIVAFAESAKVSAYSALPYFNLCAMYYNDGRMDEAMSACDRAIASDPVMSEAYYIKACVLFGKGKGERGIYVAPPETRPTMNKYLELAPFGEHAQFVRQMLDKLDAPVDSSYQAARPVKK